MEKIVAKHGGSSSSVPSSNHAASPSLFVQAPSLPEAKDDSGAHRRDA